MALDWLYIGHGRCLYTFKRQCANTMDGLGHSHMQLFNLDLHGYKRQGYSESTNGTYVFVISDKSNMELDRQWALNTVKKDILL